LRLVGRPKVPAVAAADPRRSEIKTLDALLENDRHLRSG